MSPFKGKKTQYRWPLFEAKHLLWCCFRFCCFFIYKTLAVPGFESLDEHVKQDLKYVTLQLSIAVMLYNLSLWIPLWFPKPTQSRKNLLRDLLSARLHSLPKQSRSKNGTKCKSSWFWFNNSAVMLLCSLAFHAQEGMKQRVWSWRCVCSSEDSSSVQPAGFHRPARQKQHSGAPPAFNTATAEAAFPRLTLEKRPRLWTVPLGKHVWRSLSSKCHKAKTLRRSSSSLGQSSP